MVKLKKILLYQQINCDIFLETFEFFKQVTILQI